MQWRERTSNLGLTALRITVGIIMTAHGWQKLSDLQGWQDNLANMGLPAASVMAPLAVAGEFLGGLGLIAGLLTPLAAFGVAAVMAVAILTVHLPHGLFASNNGFEYPLTLLMVAVYFITRGGGPISADALLKKSAAKRSAGQTGSRTEPAARDRVTEAGEESFPASDAPGYSPSSGR